MPYCTKCGREISETDSFCPNCGASLKPGIPSPVAKPVERVEKEEKREKEEKKEKSEKEEKHEKGEAMPIFPLLGGFFLIFLGIIYFLNAFRIFPPREIGAYFILFLGIIIIIAAVFAGITASKRHPKP